MLDQRKRHGCLTAVLIFMIVLNSAYGLVFLLGLSEVHQMFPNIPGWGFPLYGLLSLLTVVCAIALLKWKKWGFWGLCALSVIALVVNVSAGFGMASSFGGVIGVLLLYGLLQIGKGKKAWPQLE